MMESSVYPRIDSWWIDDDEKVTQANERLPADLVRVAGGEVPLPDAFLTIAHYNRVQPCVARDLLEREVWTVTVIMEASNEIWGRLKSPTLRFLPDRGGPEQGHLELGRFGHLAALGSPSEGERALIASTSPCWARVARHPGRELRGYNGPLACAYEPISVEEAVATLGLGRIMARIEAATREAGAKVLAEARSQEERRAQLLPVEHMLGWQSDPTSGRPRSLSMRLLTMLLATPRSGWLAVATFLALLVVPLCFLISLPLILLARAPSIALLIWKCQ